MDFFVATKSLTVEGHNSPIYDEYQTQEAKVSTLLWKRAHQAIQTIPHNLYVSVKLTSLYCGLIKAYPNPQ